ncbi:MAG TPA: hypothetical protein VGJ50_02170 [Streptosporangiaceae bacterium]|jgi:hypothetical protein
MAQDSGYGEDGIYFDHRGDCRDGALHKSCVGRWRWVPKELRTSFVSMMSYQGVPVEEIARLTETRTQQSLSSRGGFSPVLPWSWVFPRDRR